MKTKKLLFTVCLIAALAFKASFAQNTDGLIAFKTKNSNPYLVELSKGASLPNTSSFKASIDGKTFLYMIRRDRVSGDALAEAANYFQTKVGYYQLGALSFVSFNLNSLPATQPTPMKKLEAKPLSAEARQLITDIEAAKK